MRIKYEKIYEVDFISYTNCLNDTVSDWDGKSNDFANVNYLNLPKFGSCLVKEDDLEKYKKYGQGYKNIRLVGYLINEE